MKDDRCGPVDSIFNCRVGLSPVRGVLSTALTQTSGRPMHEVYFRPVGGCGSDRRCSTLGMLHSNLEVSHLTVSRLSFCGPKYFCGEIITDQTVRRTFDL
jgi:hypothetical protein